MNSLHNYPSEFRWISVIGIIVILIGAVFYHLMEHLSWLDAVYLLHFFL